MQKKETEESEESEEPKEPSKKELTKREKKEQKRKEKKKRDERNEDEDADLLEDAEATPLSPGTHVPFPSSTEQEKEQKEKHYKDSLTAIAVNCEVVVRWQFSPDHSREPHQGRDAPPQRSVSSQRRSGASERPRRAHPPSGDVIADEGVQRHSPRLSSLPLSRRTTRSTLRRRRRRRVWSARRSARRVNTKSR